MKIWAVNLGLLIATAFFLQHTYDIWAAREKLSLFPVVSEEGKLISDERISEEIFPSEAAFEGVAKQNLFSPDRSEPLVEEPADAATAEPPKLSEKRIALYGVIMAGDYTSALISNPVQGPGQRQDRWVKRGDVVGEYTVADIKKESILVTEGEKNYEILLYDNDKPKRNGGSSVKSDRPSVVTAGSKPEPQPSQSKPSAASASKPAEKAAPAEAEYEIIKTPFGEIRRKKEG